MTDIQSLKTRQDSKQLSGDPVRSLIAANVAALNESKNILQGLSTEHYNASCKPVFQSTLGAHFRHLLEHYSCFLAAVTGAEKLICYDSRRRDIEIERNRPHALQVLDSIVTQLCALKLIGDATATQYMRDQDVLAPTPTTLSRELLFLQSHTVHHHAMIAAMCRIHGHKVPENFGVAIATQAFQAAQQACDANQPALEKEGLK